MMDFLTDQFRVDRSRIDGPVLVTGAGACIGAWTVAILRRSNVPLVAFGHRDDRRRPVLLHGEEGAKELVWETGDITDASRLQDICSHHRIRSLSHRDAGGGAVHSINIGPV